MIQCLDETEAIEQAMSSRRDEFSEFKARMISEKEEIDAGIQADRDMAGRTRIGLGKCLQGNQSRYHEQISDRQGQVKGAAVAAVEDAVCQGCNLNIPPQLYNELQRFDQFAVLSPLPENHILEGACKIGQSRPNDRRIFVDPEESPNTTGQGAP